MSKHDFDAVNDNKPTCPEEDSLPRWDLSGFGYDDVNCPAFKKEVDLLVDKIDSFAAQYQGTIKDLSGDELAQALKDHKTVNKLASKIFTYASLKKSAEVRKYTPMLAGLSNDLSPHFSKLAFFGDEMMKLSDRHIEDCLVASGKLRRFEPVLKDYVRGRIHDPGSLDLKKYMGEISPESDWQRLFSELQVKPYNFEGRDDMSQEEILTIMSNDPDQQRRKKAHKVFEERMKENLPVTTAVHNALMRLQSVDNRWTNFEHPWDARHFSNDIDPKIVDALETAVKGTYKSISERFFKIKAQLTGQEKLAPWDRNAPVPALEADADYIPYGQAKEIVLNAYKGFSPRMAAIVQDSYDENWIDVPAAKGKAPGAFSAGSASYDVHPFVLLNYLGQFRDVMTLAHELGHAVHQKLASHKGDYIKGTPLTMAETASIFGEMATFQSLLKNADNDDQRRILLFEKIGDMISSSHRQISFYDFEKRIHTKFKEKNGQPLTSEEMGKEWVGALGDSYGDAIELDEETYGPLFGYIPHFVGSPFYVYAYAFGDALVNALYRVYEEGSVSDFEDKYIKMLEAGGTYTLDDLKNDFGLDARDPAFWNKGLDVIRDMLDELEDLCQPLLDQKPKPAAARKSGPGPV